MLLWWEIFTLWLLHQEGLYTEIITVHTLMVLNLMVSNFVLKVCILMEFVRSKE